MKREKKNTSDTGHVTNCKEGAVKKPETAEKTPEEFAAEYLDGWKRCQAEFENYKKRQAESQKELAGYLIEKLLFDIIPVLDNFRMATGHVPEDAKDSPWVTGIQYIEKQLEDALRSHGVEVMEVREGDAFDPTKMEAVSSDEEASEGKQVVGKVLQNGYRIGERVVRAAKVNVINK